MTANAARAFTALSDALLQEPDVESGTGFGANPGLRSKRKIFAMLIDDQLVVKLPAKRCDELVAASAAERYERGQGRPLKQWVSIGEHRARNWLEIAEEALRSANTNAPTSAR